MGKEKGNNDANNPEADGPPVGTTVEEIDDIIDHLFVSDMKKMQEKLKKAFLGANLKEGEKQQPMSLDYIDKVFYNKYG